LDALGPPDWGLFLARQRAGCVERQRAAGLDSAWLAQIPAFLDAVALDSSPRRVLLHTGVMREHLLVTPHPDGCWSLSGLFDFEPAMRGAREYEFAAPSGCSSHAAMPASCGAHPGRTGRPLVASALS